MSTANNVELLIITIVLCVYFVASTVLVYYVIKLVKKTHDLTKRAEAAVDSVESAAKTMKNFSKSGLPLVTMINKLFTKGKSED